MNLGQLVRAWCAPSSSSTRRALNKVQGLPFRAAEIENKILEMINR